MWTGLKVAGGMALLFFTWQDFAKAKQSACNTEDAIEIFGEKLLQTKTISEQLSPLERGGDCQCKYYYSKNRDKCADRADKKKGKASKCHEQGDKSGCEAVEKSSFKKCKWVPPPTPRPTPPTPEPTPEPTPAPTPCCNYKENPDKQCKSGDGLRPLELRWQFNLENNRTQCATDVCNAWKWCKGYSVLKKSHAQGPFKFYLCDLIVDYDLWMQEHSRDPDTFKQPESYDSTWGGVDVIIEDPVTGKRSEFSARNAHRPYSYGEGGLRDKPKGAINEWTCYQKIE